jgi:molecular chaperone GrpE
VSDQDTALPDGDEDQASDEAQQLTEQLQRLAADFANYRRRAEREKVEAKQAADRQLLLELLTVLDDFERAEQYTDVEHHQHLVDGLGIVSSRLHGVLASHGLAQIEAEQFDPQLHEAVGMESSELPSGQIVRVLQRGWRVGDRVLRHAQVIVSQ